ncbi:isochorismate synthase [Nocardiopsis halotolerans]|uniref:isochorismate synthase n=1 Tax=Nocardiopsis halotolerans TaxID=124252 RepID=UPI00037E277C|nr:isochorismate synthase [Nocardiopsis halotolerans]
MAPETCAGPPTPFAWSTPAYALRVGGGGVRFRPLPADAPTGREADAALREARAAGWEDPRIVGALPFRTDAPAELMVADTVRDVRAGPYPAEGPGGAPSSGPPPRHRLREEPSAEEYARLVGRAVERLSRAGLDKVVLARTLLVDTDAPLDTGRVLKRLAERDPDAFTFAVQSLVTHDGEDSRSTAPTLVGASPELLVARNGPRVRSHPLAGSAPRHPDPETDRERARALLASPKDLREHAFVVADVAERLRPLCSRLDVPPSPSVTATATMWHLGTSVTGVLREPPPSALELAAILHPTPAVRGTPAGAAARAIRAWEPFDRGLYAGAVGWCDADGNGEWAVALRCAEIAGTRARLFAGAGIVADSVPADEAAETGAKFRTMLDALGLGAPGPGPTVPASTAPGEHP